MVSRESVITIAIAIDMDIGAVIIVVSMRLAGALGPPAHRRHDSRRGHKHVHWDRQCQSTGIGNAITVDIMSILPMISMMTATAISDLRGDESAATIGREHGGAARDKL